MDHLYNYSLDELGIDLAIDDEGKIWMHEANNGPVTRFYEEERAVHTIAYAKYIAQNGIMYTDFSTKRQIMKGQFDASKSNMPVATNERSMNVGILTTDKADLSLLQELHNASIKKDIQLCYFTPKDIDYTMGLIRANFFDNRNWVQKVSEYPDVVLDHLKLRGNETAEVLYEEFSDVRFVNDMPYHKLTKERIYKKLDDKYRINNFKKVNKTRDVFELLEDHSAVLLRSNMLSKINTYFEIIRTDEKYVVKDKKGKKEYSELTLRHYLSHLLEKDTFTVQPDNRYRISDEKLLSMDVYLIKGGVDWQVLNKKIVLEKQNSNYKEMINLDDLSNSELKLDSIKETIERDLSRTAVHVAEKYESNEEYNIHELFIKFTFDEKLELEVIDINPYCKQEINDITLYASTALENAIENFSDYSTVVIE